MECLTLTRSLTSKLWQRRCSTPTERRIFQSWVACCYSRVLARVRSASMAARPPMERPTRATPPSLVRRPAVGGFAGRGEAFSPLRRADYFVGRNSDSVAGRRAHRRLYDRLQFAALVKLADNVAAAHELAVDIDLRNRRPIAVDFHTLTNFLVGEHVNGFVRSAQFLEDLDGRRRKAAHREIAVALHENDDLVVLDRRLDTFARA